MPEKKKVVIYATGGTIAGVGHKGKTVGYHSGVITAEQLIKDIPQINDVVDVETVQFCNVNSDDMSGEEWIRLARTINERAKDENTAGFVITHGTDTLEETAYFLNLTVKTDKPVVLTGSMRPSTAISADGPLNLYQAVIAAASKETFGKGVLAVFSDHIYAARSVTKTNTYHVMAISAGEMGAAGIIRDDMVYMYEVPDKKHTLQTEFDVSGLSGLPKVSILYFAVDADPALLSYAASCSDGLVIAGAGAGEYSLAYKAVIEKLKIPVVISSRIYDGVITQNGLLSENTVAANNLPPQKAAVLLRLALTKTKDTDEIKRMFSVY